MFQWIRNKLMISSHNDGRHQKIASIQAKFDVANAVLEQLGGRRDRLQNKRVTVGDRRKLKIENFFPERRRLEMPQMS